MLYTIPIELPLPIASGLHDILGFINQSTGVAKITKITAYTQDNDIAIRIRRNAINSDPTTQFVTTISGLIPIWAGVSMLASGFKCERWDVNSGFPGISGYNPVEGDVISASMAKSNGYPAESHWHKGLHLGVGDSFVVQAHNFGGGLYGSILMTVELQMDLASTIAPMGQVPNLHDQEEPVEPV